MYVFIFRTRTSMQYSQRLLSSEYIPSSNAISFYPTRSIGKYSDSTRFHDDMLLYPAHFGIKNRLLSADDLRFCQSLTEVYIVVATSKYLKQSSFQVYRLYLFYYSLPKAKILYSKCLAKSGTFSKYLSVELLYPWPQPVTEPKALLLNQCLEERISMCWIDILNLLSPVIASDEL